MAPPDDRSANTNARSAIADNKKKKEPTTCPKDEATVSETKTITYPVSNVEVPIETTNRPAEVPESIFSSQLWTKHGSATQEYGNRDSNNGNGDKRNVSYGNGTVIG